MVWRPPPESIWNIEDEEKLVVDKLVDMEARKLVSKYAVSLSTAYSDVIAMYGGKDEALARKRLLEVYGIKPLTWEGLHARRQVFY